MGGVSSPRSIPYRYGSMIAFGLVGIVGLAMANLGRFLAVGIPPERAWQAVIGSLAAPAVLVVLGAIAGVLTNERTGLHSHVYRWASTGRTHSFSIRRLAIGAVMGLGIGLIVLAYDYWTGMAGSFSTTAPDSLVLLTVGRILYLGIAQEVVLRWGVVSLLVFFGLSWFRIAGDDPSRAYVILGAIVLVSAVLSFAQVSGTVSYGTEPVRWVSAMVVNFVPGVVFGGLFWRFSLEAAMVAHMASHLPLIATLLLG